MFLFTLEADVFLSWTWNQTVTRGRRTEGNGLVDDPMDHVLLEIPISNC